MAKAKKSELESPAPILDAEDEETLAAIDEGIQDAKAGRTVPAGEVHKRLPKWISASSTRKGRWRFLVHRAGSRPARANAPRSTA